MSSLSRAEQLLIRVSPALAIVLLTLGGLGAATDAAAQTGGRWTQWIPSDSPLSRESMAMASDGFQVVLFGGATSSSRLNDTWTRGPIVVPAPADGSTSFEEWMQASPPTSPPARRNASLVYDPVRLEYVLFGGLGEGDVSLNDTWIWNGYSWTERHPATSPPPRYYAGMAHDAARNQVVLYGGVTQSVIPNDTWIWDGTNWTQQLAPAPESRYGAAMAWDPSTSTVLMFGGFIVAGPSAATRTNETWSWDGTAWIPRAPVTPPPAREFAAMAQDVAHGKIVLFGGIIAQGLGTSSANDTWVWDGSNWTDVTPLQLPDKRYHAAMAWDGDAVLLFGGRNGAGVLGDTWEWNGSAWTQPTSPLSPPGRYEGAMAFHEGTSSIVLFGGYNGFTGHLGDTWTWNDASWNRRWTRRVVSPSPVACSGPAMAEFPPTGTLVLCGGFDGTGFRGESWTWDGAAWTLQSPASAPSGRSNAAIAYDPVRAQVVLFGGYVGGLLNDTWTWDGSTWTQRSPAHSPPHRSTAEMVFDPATGTLLLFGGNGAGGVVLRDTWSWDGSDWSQLSPATLPPARYAQGMATDGYSSTVVIFGGWGSAPIGDTWTWNGADWSQESASPAPGPRYLSHMAYDPVRREAVLFGGQRFDWMDDTWIWRTAPGPTAVPPSSGALTFALPPAPHPVAGHTVFSYVIGNDLAASKPVTVELALYDLQGRRMRMLERGARSPGLHRVSWDATDDRGTAVPPGVYCLRLRAGDLSLARKVVVTR